AARICGQEVAVHAGDSLNERSRHYHRAAGNDGSAGECGRGAKSQHTWCKHDGREPPFSRRATRRSRIFASGSAADGREAADSRAPGTHAACAQGHRATGERRRCGTGLFAGRSGGDHRKRSGDRAGRSGGSTGKLRSSYYEDRLTAARRRRGGGCTFGSGEPFRQAAVNPMLLTLLPYLTVAANLVLVLGILLGVSDRVSKLRTQTVKQEKKWQAEAARLMAEVTELKGQVLALEQLDRTTSLTGHSLVGGPAGSPAVAAGGSL